MVSIVNQGCRIYEIVDDEPETPFKAAQKTFDLKNFDQLDVRDGVTVVATAQSAFRVRAEGDSTDLADLRLTVSSTTLRVEYARRRNRRHPMRVEAALPALARVGLSGAASADVQGFRAPGELRFDLEGATSLRAADVRAATLRLGVAGASSVQLAGSADRLRADVSGASVLGAFDCPAEESSLTIGGASTARVWVSRQLEVEASGASSVLYRGQPVTSIRTSGGSTVSPQGG